MYNYGINMLRDKKQETNVSSYNKWQVCNIINLCHILNLSACAPLSKMSCKKVTKKEDNQFQVGYVSYLNFKKKEFKEQVDKFLSYQFDSKTSTKIRRTLK